MPAPIAKRAVSGGRSSWPRVLSPLLEERDEAGERLAVEAAGAVPGGGPLDHGQPGDVRLGGEQLDHRPQGDGDPLRPGLAGGRGVGPGDVGDDDVVDGAEGLEEAGLLVVEELVEGGAGDSGDLDHLGDGGRRVPFLRRDADHRFPQPLALGRPGTTGPG